MEKKALVQRFERLGHGIRSGSGSAFDDNRLRLTEENGTGTPAGCSVRILAPETASGGKSALLRQFRDRPAHVFGAFSSRSASAFSRHGQQLFETVDRDRFRICLTMGMRTITLFISENWPIDSY